MKKRRVNFNPFVNVFLLLIPSAMSVVLLSPRILAEMSGEEGAFAYLLSGKSEGRKVMWNGSLNGTDFLDFTEHPISLYYSMKLVGPIVKWVLNPVVDEIVAFKALPIIFFLIIYVAHLLLSRKQRMIKTSLLASLTLFVFAYHQTNLGVLQTDTTIGFALFLLATYIYLQALKMTQRTKPRMAILLMFFSGILLGLGKQEWSIASLVAVVSSLLISRYYKNFGSINIHIQSIQKLFFLGAGIVLGIAVSYLLDPRAYIGGFNVIWRTILNPISDEGFPLDRYIAATLPRIISFSFFVLVITLYFVLIFSRSGPAHERKLLVSFPAILAVFNFLPSIISFWNGDTRYLAPIAGIVVCFPMLIQQEFDFDKSLLPKREKEKDLRLALLISSLLIAFSLIRIPYSLAAFENHEKTDFPKFFFGGNVKKDCVYYIDPATAFYSYGRVNWVNSWMGEIGARAYFEEMKKSDSNDSLVLCSEDNQTIPR